jgi:OOP family OmpA-OmpF porin
MTIRFVVPLMAAAIALSGLSACSKKDDAAEIRAAEAAAAERLPAGPATMETVDAAPAVGTTLQTTDGAAPVGPATMATVTADFDPASVAQTTASLPPFPFFKDPEGLENDLKGNDALKPFDRHYFIAGGKLVSQEGKIGLFQYNLDNPPSGRPFSLIEFHRNYENAIRSLGGQKISSTQFTPELLGTVGGREALEKFWRGSPPVPEAEHYSYLIRNPAKEYWIHVSAGGTVPLIGFVTVLEKQAMQSSLAFLDAAAMKKELDAKGRVALYINFDVDKATLRPDAQPIIDEINKLLVADGSLKLSIEGHTDATGGAEHNRQLSASRARSVYGALAGLGVDPSRLSSRGFGPDKPIADNSTEDGRAKNRRVELVKVN